MSENKMREQFERACGLLPDGVHWGDAITPEIVMAIAALQPQPEPVAQVAACSICSGRGWVYRKGEKCVACAGTGEEFAAPPTPAADVAPERVGLLAHRLVGVVMTELSERQGFLANEAGIARAIRFVLDSIATPAASAGAVAQEETALQQYRRFAGTEPSTPLEDLRFFLSCALKGQDWLDVEPFLDALPAAPAEPAAGDVVPRAQYSESVRKWRDTFESMHQRAMRAERALADRESRIAALTEANERLEAHADRMAHSHIPKNAKVYELESRIAALEGERERERAKLAASEARVGVLTEALSAVVNDLKMRADMKLKKEERGVVDVGQSVWLQANAALSPVASHDAAPTTGAGG